LSIAFKTENVLTPPVSGVISVTRLYKNVFEMQNESNAKRVPRKFSCKWWPPQVIQSLFCTIFWYLMTILDHKKIIWISTFTVFCCVILSYMCHFMKYIRNYELNSLDWSALTFVPPIDSYRTSRTFSFLDDILRVSTFQEIPKIFGCSINAKIRVFGVSRKDYE